MLPENLYELKKFKEHRYYEVNNYEDIPKEVQKEMIWNSASGVDNSIKDLSLDHLSSLHGFIKHKSVIKEFNNHNRFKTNTDLLNFWDSCNSVDAKIHYLISWYFWTEAELLLRNRESVFSEIIEQNPIIDEKAEEKYSAFLSIINIK